MEFCFACLAFDVKLHGTKSNEYLNACYEQLSGFKVQSFSERSYICYQCLALVIKYVKFANTCRKSADFLRRIWKGNIEITQEILLSEQIVLSNLPLSITKNTNIIDIVYASSEDIQNGNTVVKENDRLLPDSNSISIAEPYIVEIESDQSPNSILVTQKKVKRKKKTKIENCLRTKQKSFFEEEFVTEIILTLEEQKAELKERELSLNYLNCPMKCEFCFKGFLDSEAFKNHMVKHDKSAGTFVCSVCLLRYANARRLREHTATAHARRFRCIQCGHLSHTTGQARVHENWHKGVTFQCQLCGEIFAKPTTHLNHMRKKHPTNHVCQICGLSFIGKHGLSMHKRKTHGGSEIQPSFDKTIDKGLENINNKEEDIDNKHGDTYCKDCDICFVSNSALMRHIMSSSKHAIESNCGNVCRICGESFLTPTSLTRHFRCHSLRTPQVRVSCDKCDATFASGAGYCAHRSRAHRKVDNASEPRCFVCDVCGKTCRSNAVLQYHLRIHTGKRPFPCQNCPKRFPDKTQLSLHTRTHSGERPYKCPKCPAKFKQKGASNRHMKMHTGERPHQCKICLKMFSRMGTLRNHIASLHLTQLKNA